MSNLHLPQIVFTLRAVQYPSTIPLSLASLHLIRENASSFSSSIFGLLDETANVAEQLASVRKLYEIDSIKNKVPDGKEPFPENRQTLLNGISIEFKYVCQLALSLVLNYHCQECLFHLSWH